MLQRISWLLFVWLIVAVASSAQTKVPTPRTVVPDINGRAIELVKPKFPESAVADNADGAGLIVRVVVDVNGAVVSAQCSINCHLMLRDAAEMAAKMSSFKPLLINGQAVEYEGTLHFSFVVERVDWARFGTALESTRQFDNISFGPVAQMLSKAYSDEKEILIALDANGGVDFDARQRGIGQVETSLKSKLNGTERWLFGAAMALRRVTFWTMAGGATNRTELETAIDDLPRFISSAPEEVSKSLIQQLTQLSKFKVPSNGSERELRSAISDISRSIRF